MLPAEYRLRTPAHYRAVLRGRGSRRAGGDLLVVHVASAQRLADTLPDDQSDRVRVGFVVSKVVGNAVVRNRTKRRLRHLVAHRLGQLPSGAGIVIRALPAAANADSASLAVELDRLLRRVSGDPVAAGAR